jgi:adenylate cyclase
MALAYALKGDKKNTATYLQLLEDMAKVLNGFTADSYLFLMYVVTHDYDKAVEWTENAIQNKSSLLLLRFTDPIAYALKEDDRFK